MNNKKPMDYEEPEIILLYIRRMRSSPGRRPYRPNTGCQLLFKSDKTAGIIMAIPFVVCFALFGIFNLTAGVLLTAEAAKRRNSQKALRILEGLLKEHADVPDNFLDPMKVVGTILLITGSMLLIVGVLLGVVACRSANYESRRRSSCASFNAFPMSSTANGPPSLALMSNVGRQLSNKLKLVPVNTGKTSIVTATTTKTPAKTITTLTTVDIHHTVDEVFISANGEPPAGSESCDLILRDSSEKRRTCSIDLSDDIQTTSQSLTNIAAVSSKSPVKKAFSVSWASSVGPMETESSTDPSIEEKIINIY